MIQYRQIETSSPLYQGERELRNEFLLRPIGIPDYGWEMYDESSYHFVAVDGEEVVGCVVLYPLLDKSGAAQLMQMAVADGLRGKGVGRGLVDCLVEFARSTGFTSIVCHSRDNAVGFYLKLGFKCFGEPFVEVGVEHRHMKLDLR